MHTPTTTRLISARPSPGLSSFCRYAGPVFIAMALCLLMRSIAPPSAIGGRILYLVVSCLVTIYFWTPAILRDTVSEPNPRRRGAPIFRRVPVKVRLQLMFRDYGVYGTAAIVALVIDVSVGELAQHTRQVRVAQPLFLFLCMLTLLRAARAMNDGRSACVSVSSNDDRDLKAVRT
jgi:hypothetical protein